MFLKLFRLIIIIVFASSTSFADQMVFAKKKLQILTANGKQEFTVFVANTEAKREHGLMERKNMPKNNGMLFLFDKEAKVKMWMKNTYIPLDMVFIKSDGTISEIITDTKPLSLETIVSTEKIIAVLELNAGMCKKFGIKKSDKIIF